MTLEIVEEPSSHLAEYATVSTRFEVTHVFDAEGITRLRCGAHASPSRIHPSCVKDYDSYAGAHPITWPARFAVSGWTILAAHLEGKRVGGAVIAVDDPQLDLVRDLPGVGVLWDLRVTPDVRRHGVGSALLRAAEDAAARRGARVLRVETQQVNVPACQFYRRHGFLLEQVVPGAYASLPDEIQLLWRKPLDRRLDHSVVERRS